MLDGIREDGSEVDETSGVDVGVPMLRAEDGPVLGGAEEGIVGSAVGIVAGMPESFRDGAVVSSVVGALVWSDDGVSVGMKVGYNEEVGKMDGMTDVGDSVGKGVGSSEVAADGSELLGS